MFEKLATFIKDTPLSTFNRKYYNGEDKINIIPLVDVLEPEEVETLNEQIKKFNDFHTVENVGVSTIGYNNQDLSWWKHDWQVKNKVADKLAVALIEPNAQDRIKEIIVAIASEVS